jgi:hypothetical protein
MGCTNTEVKNDYSKLQKENDSLRAEIGLLQPTFSNNIESLYHSYKHADLILLDMNNDGDNDSIEVLSSEIANDYILLIKMSNSSSIYRETSREIPTIIHKKDMEKGFGLNIGDGLMDMCEECSPSVIRYEHGSLKRSGLVW